MSTLLGCKDIGIENQSFGVKLNSFTYEFMLQKRRYFSNCYSNKGFLQDTVVNLTCHSLYQVSSETHETFFPGKS